MPKQPESLKYISGFGEDEKKLVIWGTVISVIKGDCFSKVIPSTLHRNSLGKRHCSWYERHKGEGIETLVACMLADRITNSQLTLLENA